MGSKSLPTVDELINSLKRSFIPTILIEGPDDVFIYKYLKSQLNTSLVSLQPCGGRTSLFSIYDRRDEFEGKNVVFIADKDAYRFTPIPPDKSGIIFTSGYCIENDLYEGSDISNFIDEEDRPNHELLREIIGKWFAFEVENYNREKGESRPLRVKEHINVVSPVGLNNICPDFAVKIDYTEPSDDALRLITEEYNLNVRGKQLFQMLSRFLSHKGRFSNFSDKHLMEIALKQGNNVLLDKLVTDLNSSIFNA